MRNDRIDREIPLDRENLRDRGTEEERRMTLSEEELAVGQPRGARRRGGDREGGRDAATSARRVTDRVTTRSSSSGARPPA